jgi:hypothetical protein
MKVQTLSYPNVNNPCSRLRLKAKAEYSKWRYLLLATEALGQKYTVRLNQFGYREIALERQSFQRGSDSFPNHDLDPLTRS